MASTTPAARLDSLTTEALIAEYERCDANRYSATAVDSARTSNPRQHQQRINAICDLLADRADEGDEAAAAWLATA